MKADNCRHWREWLGAHALGKLDAEERAGLEAHLEGCPECRAELASLEGVAKLLPLADPGRIGTAPATPPVGLGDRISRRIASERRAERRRRRRTGFALGGATAAVAAAMLAIFVIGGGDDSGPPERHVSFAALPAKMKIGATLIPHAYGTEIHVYVKGVRSGELCRVFLRDRRGARMSAGSFRYRWGEDSNAVLSAALDLSRTATVGIRVGERTFEAPVNPPRA